MVPMPDAPLPNEFTIVVSDEDGRVTVRCEGELDIAVTTAVRDAVIAVLRGEPDDMALDWTGVTFMDSSGIRLLLQILLLCREHGVDLTWTLSDAARKTLDLVGIHDALLREYAARSATRRDD